ncbi:MAG: hypothetical protein JSR53_11825 [Proteobacteria bacterium]|nr:hypothetical protein [Pseudomonadota bacterium]
MPVAAQLPAQIEVFRAGRHMDDAGSVHSFTEADLAAMATGYDPALREAPLTVGHPADNLPAYGWVKAVGRNAAGALTIDTHQVEPQFAQMVQDGRFKKRSASFYAPNSPHNPRPGQWYLRHVAFLGAQPPAIAGLKDMQFSEGDASEGAVCFSLSNPPTLQEPDPMDEELKQQLAKAQADLAAAQAETAAAKAQAASFAEAAAAERKAGYVAFAQAQIERGQLAPKDKDLAVATLQALAGAEPVSFSEGGAQRQLSPAQWLQDFIASRAPVVAFGEFAGAHRQAPVAGRSDAEIDQAARADALQHKVDYAAALVAVTSFTA